MLAACQPPPPAPVGLDESARYLVREFYSDDTAFAQGVQGFMDWYASEGIELEGQRPDAGAENSDAFSIDDLAAEDVAQLPLLHGRDPIDAAGTVSLARMDCGVVASEDLLVRPDQFHVFSEDWDGYERTFTTSRQTWQDASRSGDYARVTQDLDVFAEDFDPAPWESSLMLTSNLANPAPELGGLADLDAYIMYLDFRHGSYDVSGEESQAFLILSYIAEPAVRENSDQRLNQSYSIEINVARPGGSTVRMLAVWTEIEGGGMHSDDDIVKNYAVNKAQDSSERLSAICAGEIEIEDEP
jgi:hypothetical protein